MAGKIIADTIQTENTFLQLNVGATQIATMNTSGIFSSSGAKMLGTDGSIGNSTISGATVSGNLSFDSTGTSGIRLPAANTLAFHTAGTEDMRIDATGNVGIGVTATTQKLYVNGSACFPNDSKLGFHGNPSAATISNYYSGNDTSNYLTMFAGGTERMRIATDGTISTTIGSTLYGAYPARAWVNFNGTGTVAIRQSRNVSSITDNGTGDYTVNLTTAMPDGEYSALASGGTGGNNIRMASCAPVSATSTSQIRVIGITINADALIDLEVVSVAVFR